MVVQSYGSPYVQQATLEKLVCTKCKKYLSYPPIYRNVTAGPICGRCPIDNAENFVRDELYENAVEFQKFPCIYYEYGCLESLFPCQVAEHEKKCQYMRFNCPTGVHNNCTWEGTLGTVIEHFESKHPTYILKDSQFEVGFANNHMENYIMPYAENIYVVTWEANSTEETFSIIVSYMGTNYDINNYIYTLTLESGDRDFSFSISENVGKQLQLVKGMLHGPVPLITNISIHEVSTENNSIAGETENETEETTKPLLDYEQLAELECPICLEYMIPPIFQCDKCHSICNTCTKTQKECPICRGTINERQNYVLGKVIDNILYPCKHTGCKYVTKARDIRQHEATCLFGPFKCPLQEYEQCIEVFPVSQLFNHIKEKHYESLIELDTISIPIDSTIEDDIVDNKFENDVVEGYILEHSKLLFKLCFKYVQSKNMYYWAVQFIGPAEESTKYKYELEIIDNNGTNSRLYVKTSCSPLTANDTSFKNEAHFISFDNALLAKFIKSQLTYRVRIITEK